MLNYSFYLYNDEGGLIGSAAIQLASDEAARSYVQDVFQSYPACEEVEIWITPRYVGQGRRRNSSALEPAGDRGRPTKLRWKFTACA